MMANVLHPHIAFQPRPVSHAPSPFGFGFGLGPSTSTSMLPSTGWSSSTPGHTNPASFHQLQSMAQSAFSRPQKRRLSSEDDSENVRYPSAPQDESMDRSPTPEHSKRAATKRARAAHSSSLPPKDDETDRPNQNNGGPDGNDADMGLLLANLPTESLLPLLLRLLKEQPSLKTILLPLIPHPAAKSAIEVLSRSATKITESYPLSERDAYILARLRDPIAKYVSICMTYFPYFSCTPLPPQALPSASGTSQNHTTLPTYSSDKPLESFTFLYGVTEQILKQRPQSQRELLKALKPRLEDEWEAWRNKTTYDINHGHLYATDTRNKYSDGLGSLESLARQNGDADLFTTNVELVTKVRSPWMKDNGWSIERHSHQMEQ